ncbi:15883_t:CDS:2 [Gigaspora margarita]|uniref:15883_t:CDS:1 n=1 Tax=Gigaspora margarita TaxID=4874 RepID=A0ABN7WC41_GIGMA|nr:15883_t:CDS:2 [Gigaspora margarita]
MLINDSSSSNPLKSTSAKCKTDKAKGNRPRILIWDNYIEVEDDWHRHFGATLYCQRPVLDDIRRRWLIEVVKRDKKVNNNKDNEISIRKKNQTNQSIMLHY